VPGLFNICIIVEHDKAVTDCDVQLFGESIRSELLLTVKIKITEKLIKDQNQKSLVKTNLDQRSKITKIDLKS